MIRLISHVPTVLAGGMIGWNAPNPPPHLWIVCVIAGLAYFGGIISAISVAIEEEE